MRAQDRVDPTRPRGAVVLGDTDLTDLSDKQMTQLRRDRIGFVFQAFNLVPTLTALENITLPVDIAGRKVDREWLDTVVTRLGLGDRLDHRPGELSGGQQQRVACARALAGRPDIIFGDEPTGNLDSRSSGEVMSILRAAVDEFGGVAPDDPGRCDQMLIRGFVQRVDVAPDRFHRFTLNGDVDAECRRYESLLARGCDLAILGIGTNGHLGMNEPGSPADGATRRVDLAPSTIAAVWFVIVMAAVLGLTWLFRQRDKLEY